MLSPLVLLDCTQSSHVGQILGSGGCQFGRQQIGARYERHYEIVIDGNVHTPLPRVGKFNTADAR
jgi:hypothetical protein